MLRPLVLGVSVGLALTACQPAPTTPPASVAPTTSAPVPAPAERTAILEASDLPEPIATPLAGDDLQVTVHRLKNGMTVFASVDREKPRFVGWIAVRAGSRHDPANSTGLAHYLEHMLFKGTDEYGTLDAAAEAPHVEAVRQLYAELRKQSDPAARTKIFADIDAHTQQMAKTAVPNEFDRMYSSMGIEGLNAFTSDEQTVYIADIPANRLTQWATVEAERFSDPVFRLFYPELEAVYEEKNLSLDEPEQRVSEVLMAALLPQHPYGSQTTIGTVEHLKTPAYQDMVDYFERWYVPNNMAIVLAGDVDVAKALPELEKTFGRLAPKALPDQLPGKVVPVKGRVAQKVVAEGEQSVTAAWLTVPSSHADEPALAVMDRLLDDAKVGLINTQLELTGRVPDAYSYATTLREAGYQVLGARARAGQSLDEVERALRDVVARLRAGEFTEADVDAAKLHQAVERKMALESTWARASEITDAFVQHRPWADIVAREKKLQAITRADVMRVAKTYLGDNFVVVHRVAGKADVPKIDKPKITPVPIDPARKSAFAAQLEARPVTPLQPQWAVEGKDYQHVALPAGPMIAVKNSRNDLFSLTYQLDRGRRKEPLLCYALDLLELAGAGDQSAEAFHKQVYALGAAIETSCDAEQSYITVSGPDAQMEKALALMDGWLARPNMQVEELEKLRANTVSRRRDDLAEDWKLASALDGFAKYERRSSWLQHPNNRALAKAKIEGLRNLVSDLLDHQHRTLYFGPRSPDAVARLVARGKRHRKVGAVQTRIYRRTGGPRIFFLHKEGAKANVRFVLPQPALARPLRPAAELYSQYLSGNMSALVFQEIRESRGLAYSASATYDAGDRRRDQSGMLGFLSTQADKTPVAIETFLGLLRDSEVQPDRLAATKVAVDQTYRAMRVSPRYLGWWVLGWDERGEAADPRPWEWESMGKLDVAELGKFAARFAKAPVIIAVVGDRSRVDLNALRKIAPVQELKAEQLFSYGEFPSVDAEEASATPTP